jgi:hypothetical protein
LLRLRVGDVLSEIGGGGATAARVDGSGHTANAQIAQSHGPSLLVWLQ